MMNVYFGDIPEAEKQKYIYNTSVYFKNTYQDRWITAPLGVEIIKDVDRSDVVSASQIMSHIFGVISPTQLSGGVKTLLLVANDKKHIFNASTCGDNCAKWLLKISEKHKIVIGLRHLMDFGSGDFKIKVLNTGKIVKNMDELVMEAGEFV